MLTAEQLDERKQYIGASEAAGVLGLSRWPGHTPLAIWGHKTGEIEREDISDKLYVKLGHLFEDDMTELFEEETGKKLHRVNETQYHKTHKFIAANLDRRVVGENVPVELKTASAFKSKEWEQDEIPREYLIQCQHTLAVTEKPYMYLGVLIGNQDFKILTVQRDESVIAMIVAREVAFWKGFVEPRVMPQEATATDNDTLNKLYPNANQNTVALNDEAAQLIELIDGFDQDMKHIEVSREKYINQLKLMVGENEKGVTPGGSWIKWANVNSRRLDSKALLSKYPAVHAEFYKESSTRRFTYDIAQESKR